LLQAANLNQDALLPSALKPALATSSIVYSLGSKPPFAAKHYNNAAFGPQRTLVQHAAKVGYKPNL
jgi:hypothetical protein